jgi:hypothetical protein
MKLPPSGYKTAEETRAPGYLAKRMALYRKQIEEQKQKQEAIKVEQVVKVRKLGRADQ